MYEIRAILSQIGLWGWIGSILVLIYSSFPSKGVFRKEVAVKFAVMVSIFFIMWATGMVLF